MHLFFKKIGKHAKGTKGFTLLLMVVLLSAFLSIGLGISNILFGQIIISGQAGRSFEALYAADHGMERTLYLDRALNLCTTSLTAPCTVPWTPIPGDGFYKVDVELSPACAVSRCITVQGQDVDPGTAPTRFIRRAFILEY